MSEWRSGSTGLRRCIALILFAVSVAGCDADREPCLTDTDCFVGEACVDQECVFLGVGADMTSDSGEPPPPDMAVDSPSDLPPGDCRVDPGVCGDLACNSTTGECIVCEFDRQCGENAVCNTGACRCVANFHRCEGQCVPDDDPEECGASCTRCLPDPNGAPLCVDGECGVDCDPGFFSCGDSCPQGVRCVECETDLDCGSDAPICDDGFCTGCSSSNDCIRFLDEPICDDDACVECTPDERDACGSFSCNALTNSCTTTQTRSKDTCEACVADEECQTDQKCVPMFFAGAMRPSGYCLDTPDMLSGCGVPYPVEVRRVSLSGFPQSAYCTINEDLSTCEALKDYGRTCNDPEDCGAENVADGQCKPFDGFDRCTYDCDSSNQCSGGSTCATYCRSL